MREKETITLKKLNSFIVLGAGLELGLYTWQSSTPSNQVILLTLTVIFKQAQKAFIIQNVQNEGFVDGSGSPLSEKSTSIFLLMIICMRERER